MERHSGIRIHCETFVSYEHDEYHMEKPVSIIYGNRDTREHGDGPIA
jgi:hypothetical protein